jgi:hypothetical protein
LKKVNYFVFDSINRILIPLSSFFLQHFDQMDRT